MVLPRFCGRRARSVWVNSLIADMLVQFSEARFQHYTAGRIAPDKVKRVIEFARTLESQPDVGILMTLL